MRCFNISLSTRFVSPLLLLNRNVLFQKHEPVFALKISTCFLYQNFPSFRTSQYRFYNQNQVTAKVRPFPSYKWGGFVFGAMSICFFSIYSLPLIVKAEEEEESNKQGLSIDEESLPFYRMEELQKHNSLEKGIWALYSGKIYDVKAILRCSKRGEILI